MLLKKALFGALRNIALSEAMMSMFTLQAGLLSVFGEEAQFQHLMNSLTGGEVCLLTIFSAIGITIHGTRKMKENAGDDINEEK